MTTLSAGWQRCAMTFPDVKKGDRITGVHEPGVAAQFFVNGALKGEIRDAEFARRFFGIWLAHADLGAAAARAVARAREEQGRLKAGPEAHPHA